MSLEKQRAYSDSETVAEDPCCDDVVTVRPTHVHGCHHPPLQCHPMPWERLINICIKVILIPRLPYMPCHLLRLGIACSGFGDVRRRGAGGHMTVVSSGQLLSIRRFSSVQQFPRLTTISYPSICVSCHHNGLQGLMLWALCQLFLGCLETPCEYIEISFGHGMALHGS